MQTLSVSCSFRNTNTHRFHCGLAQPGICKPCQSVVRSETQIRIDSTAVKHTLEYTNLVSCSFRSTNTHRFHCGLAQPGICKPCQSVVRSETQIRIDSTAVKHTLEYTNLVSCSFRSTNTHRFHGGQAHTGIYKPCQLFIQKHKYT
jgi:hypothetical protein